MLQKGYFRERKDLNLDFMQLATAPKFTFCRVSYAVVGSH